METEFSGNRRIGTAAGGTFGAAGAAGQYPGGTPAPGQEYAPGAMPRGSLVWSRQPRIRSDAGDQR